MLDVADVPEFLLERRLLEPRDVVRGRLCVSDRSRLNAVFVVTADGRRPLVVKTGPRAAGEAALLERLHRAAGSGPLRAYLPAVVYADPASAVLVLDSPPGARDLARHHAGGRFSRGLAGETGRALAALHAIDPGGLRPAGERRSGPWADPPGADAAHEMTAAALELTRVIEGLADLRAALDAVAPSPPAAAVIHGDVRWDNVLVARDAGSGRWRRVQLIDWEHGGTGDPAADAGAFLGEYLRAWARSAPVVDLAGAGRPRAGAGLPLERMRPALRAFWDAYARGPSEPPGGSAAMLRRALDMAAVRLLRAALEEAQSLDRLRARVLVLVPLSRNLLCRQGDAARLLGLDGALEGA